MSWLSIKEASEYTRLKSLRNNWRRWHAPFVVVIAGRRRKTYRTKAEWLDRWLSDSRRAALRDERRSA